MSFSKFRSFLVGRKKKTVFISFVVFFLGGILSLFIFIFLVSYDSGVLILLQSRVPLIGCQTMFRIFTVITFAFTLLGPLFVLRCNCAAVSQNPVSSQAKGDDGLTSGSKAKDVLSVVDKGRGRGKSTGKDVLSATRKGKGKGKGEDWAEIIGGLTVVQSEPLPSLYTFIINEYSGNGDEDDEDDDDGFVRQSACFQEAKKTGSLTAYRVSVKQDEGAWVPLISIICWKERKRKENLLLKFCNLESLIIICASTRHPA